MLFLVHLSRKKRKKGGKKKKKKNNIKIIYDGYSQPQRNMAQYNTTHKEMSGREERKKRGGGIRRGRKTKKKTSYREMLRPP